MLRQFDIDTFIFARAGEHKYGLKEAFKSLRDYTRMVQSVVLETGDQGDIDEGDIMEIRCKLLGLNAIRILVSARAIPLQNITVWDPSYRRQP